MGTQRALRLKTAGDRRIRPETKRSCSRAKYYVVIISTLYGDCMLLSYHCICIYELVTSCGQCTFSFLYHSETVVFSTLAVMNPC